jgi:hypothetical protein
MKIAYLDCHSGISGDMTLGALVDAGVPLEAISSGVDSLGLPGCRLVASEVKRKGFRATQVTVEHTPEHTHRHLHHITGMIDRSTLSDRQKDLAKRIFTRLGEAEAKVHGTTIAKVHFHEVGAVDSIADIVGAAIGWDLLGADRIVASAVPTGGGTVEIAHGRCSIPAPATAELLHGIPLADSPVQAELTTPTGAAILASLVDAFGPLPAMSIDRIGYGAGSRELSEQPNVLRLVVGHACDELMADRIWVLETNLDDIPGEVVGYCTQQLFDAGALDVYTTAVQMKKNRPGIVLTVLCEATRVEAIELVLFRETGTLGVRRWPASRHKLPRREHRVETPWGPVEGKVVLEPGGKESFSPEYDACSRIAAARGVPLKEVFDRARQAFGEK